ncbi:ABC transporter ATP-binding protein [Candidatus Saccharibacteria bacterium]|nr:ABC transporter ATP-binding protein [Candidatus Saccharibacteria bacterium]
MRYYYLLFKKFFSLRATDKKLLFYLFATSALSTGSKLLIPFTASLVVEAATEGNFTLACINVGIFLASALLYSFLKHLNFTAYAKNALYIHDNLQQKILNKAVTFDQDFAKNISHAEIINTAFEDVTRNQRIPDYLFDFVTSALTIVADAIILVFVDPLIGAITLVLTGICMALFVYHMKKRDYYTLIQRSHQDHISDLYSQLIDGHKEVHSFNLKNDLEQVLEKDKANWKKFFGKKRLHSDLAESIVPFILGVGRIIAYLIAIPLIISGQYTVAMLVLVIGYFENIQECYEEAAAHILELSKSAVAINRMHRLLNYRPEKPLTFGNDNTDDIKGRVQFSHVCFTYEKKPQLKDVSFLIEPHSLTGVVGKSGSGKSTIFRLLLRLYKPTKGNITIDDEDIENYSKKVYTNNVSIVTQKPFVFDMTIKENLSLVDSNTEHQIAACKTVGIHDTIMRLEKGYDTPLIADGSNLSGGQKQLLALARTLLSKSEVLLFDEVTSALDADTTKQVVKVLKELKKDHTILVITHKPEIMRQMDELLVIDGGKLVGRGTHQNLLHNKFYQTLQK